MARQPFVRGYLRGYGKLHHLGFRKSSHRLLQGLFHLFGYHMLAKSRNKMLDTAGYHHLVRKK